MARKNANVRTIPMKKLGDLQMIPLARLAWDHDRINTSRQTERKPAEYKELTRSLARQGWNPQKGIINAFDDRSPIFKEYGDVIEKCYQSRVKELDRLSKTVITTDNTISNGKTVAKPHADYDLFVQAFCTMVDDPNNPGKSHPEVIRPDLIANTCNGRLRVYFDSQCLRAKGIEGVKDAETTYDTPESVKEEGVKIGYLPPSSPVWSVPVELVMFHSDAERIHAQIDENAKSQDFVEPSPRDKLATVAWFVKKEGMTQSEARDLYPGTVGQKAWLICHLDYLWSTKCSANDRYKGEPVRSNLHILDNCLRKSDEEGWLNFASMNDVVALTQLIDRSSPGSLNRRNDRIERRNLDKVKVGNEPIPTVTPLKGEEGANEIKEYFSQFAKGAKRPGNEPKVLPKKTWDTYKQSDNVIVRGFAEDHLTNGNDFLQKLNAYEDVWNSIFQALEDGKAAQIRQFLTSLYKEEEKDNQEEEKEGLLTSLVKEDNQQEELTPSQDE